jgi:hypothetical protein
MTLMKQKVPLEKRDAPQVHLQTCFATLLCDSLCHLHAAANAVHSCSSTQAHVFRSDATNRVCCTLLQRIVTYLLRMTVMLLC